MAPPAATPAADQTADSLKKLTLDGDSKTQEVTEAAEKKPTLVQSGPSNGQAPKVSAPSREPTLTPLLQEINQMMPMDPNMCYYPPTCYYGYDASGTDWQEYQRYMNQEGVDMSSGAYADMYYNGYGYSPYGAYTSPDSTAMGTEGQMYGTQHYQYPSHYYQSSTPNSVPTSQKVRTSASDQVAAADTAKANGTSKGNANGSSRPNPKPSNHNSSTSSNNAYGKGGMHGGYPTSGYPGHTYSSGAMHTPWFDSTALSAGQYIPAYNSRNSTTKNPNQRAGTHNMGAHTQRPVPGVGSATSGFLNKTYPNHQIYVPYGNTYRSGYGFGVNNYNSRFNGGYQTTDKFKSKSRGNGFYGYGNGSQDGIGELNRGPRAGRNKNPKADVTDVSTAEKEENSSLVGNDDPAALLPDIEQYNQANFPEAYSNAKFFIIKSYSEDDVHKSVKYSVWASTPNGNKKLDAAYKEAKEKFSECPVFLLFSVNTSGQFIGLAEMVGPVNFDKSVDYWQQDKWFGCFPVKWHIVKDIPNSLLKHITLEYNENKPVTNSRDTQEVKLEQGLQVLKIFKGHVSKTSILDDFEFYENRHKMIQEKRAKQQLQTPASSEGKTIAVADDKLKSSVSAAPTLEEPKALDSLSKKEAVQSAPWEAATDAPNSEKQKFEEDIAVVGGSDSRVTSDK